MNNKILCYNPSGALEFTLTDATIFSVEVLQTVNPSEALQIGCVPSSQLTFQTTHTMSSNLKLVYQKKSMSDFDWVTVGEFYVDAIQTDGTLITVSAYDAISKFDELLSEYTDLSDDETVGMLITNYLDSKGVQLDSSINWINYSMPFNYMTLPPSTTGRQLLQWAAGLEGGFITMKPNGKLYIGSYKPSGISINSSQYKSGTSVSDTPIPAINTVHIQGKGSYYDLNNKGAGAKTSVLNLYNNQLIVSLDDATTYVNRILTRVSSIGQYHTATILLFEDLGIQVGDIITVNGKKVLVMTKKMNDSGVVIYCSGSTSVFRDTTTAVDDIAGIVDRLSSKYASVDVLTNSDAKIIGGDVSFTSDINVPGLGYTDQETGESFSDNTSLVKVIQFILAQLSSMREFEESTGVINTPVNGDKLFNNLIEVKTVKGYAAESSGESTMSYVTVTINSEGEYELKLNATPNVQLGKKLGTETIRAISGDVKVPIYWVTDVAKVGQKYLANLYGKATSITYYPYSPNETLVYNSRLSTVVCNSSNLDIHNNSYLDITTDSVIQLKYIKFLTAGIYSITVYENGSEKNYMVYVKP